MLQAAEQRYTTAARLAAAAARLAAQAWDAVPLGSLDAWQPSRLAAQVAALQRLLAAGADPYLDAVLAEQNIASSQVSALDATTFVGVAGDGRSLLGLLDEPRIQAKSLIGEGLDAQRAWDRARSSLQLMSVTAVQDAGRAADSVAMVTRPSVEGYVRMLNLPSCSRCVVLAGRFYEWNAGFQRHPHCDCRHIPSSEQASGDLRTHPRRAIEAGQVTGLSRADLQAITDGADVSQVINAHRGMYTADAFGQSIKGTTEGTTKRGLAAARMQTSFEKVAGQRYRRAVAPRLRPETIYRLAGDDRQEALRLLRRFGYLL